MRIVRVPPDDNEISMRIADRSPGERKTIVATCWRRIGIESEHFSSCGNILLNRDPCVVSKCDRIPDVIHFSGIRSRRGCGVANWARPRIPDILYSGAVAAKLGQKKSAMPIAKDVSRAIFVWHCRADAGRRRRWRNSVAQILVLRPKQMCKPRCK